MTKYLKGKTIQSGCTLSADAERKCAKNLDDSHLKFCLFILIKVMTKAFSFYNRLMMSRKQLS